MAIASHPRKEHNGVKEREAEPPTSYRSSMGESLARHVASLISRMSSCTQDEEVMVSVQSHRMAQPTLLTNQPARWCCITPHAAHHQVEASVGGQHSLPHHRPGHVGHARDHALPLQGLHQRGVQQVAADEVPTHAWRAGTVSHMRTMHGTSSSLLHAHDTPCHAPIMRG